MSGRGLNVASFWDTCEDWACRLSLERVAHLTDCITVHRYPNLTVKLMFHAVDPTIHSPHHNKYRSDSENWFVN